MKAINFTARNHVQYGDLPDPVVGPDEVLIAVKTSGICHTDFEVLSANYGDGNFPVVPGHEYAGIIAEIGSAVKNLAVGDRVVVDPNINCGNCKACRKGWAHLCETLGAYGVSQNGGFAELSLVKADAVHSIGDMSFVQAALAEPMGCVLNGVDAVYDSQIDSTMIFGAGPMGMLMAIALKMKGIKNVDLVDIDEARLQMAQDFGFNGIASGSDALKAKRQAVDLVVDATGVPAVAGRLTDYIANGGKGLYFGVCPSTARIEISPFEVFRRQLTLAGSHSLNHNIPAALDIIASYGSKIEDIVSHKLSLNEVASILSAKPPKGSLKIQAMME
ncbi:alcohol dehydrogenase catalytic domain-containing protein [Paracoccus sp. JM45]|uniref:alcohol dehydrogenase catalytic domain-containing protein n=1 Tax=Paracoccus sp. JM45 TaxID=2283626 RepID=UPI000E6C7808|nr:alcohol dehydrogenase catalytic domain-containing protein [Paracoccus sp. JM45]RJE79615.1 zinc-binding dehydrogenase [Paracoccus sp. JM45]